MYVCRERLLERYERDDEHREDTGEVRERRERLTARQTKVETKKKIHMNSCRLISVYLPVPLVSSCDAMRVV